jgi:hypothetical protein
LKRASSAFLLIAWACLGRAHAGDLVLHSGNVSYAARQTIVGCNADVVSISFEWGTPIGNPGSYARHLFLPGSVGDRQIMLKVLPGGTRTGSTSDLEAKQLIQLIGGKVTGEVIFASVFPDGRDKDTGSWEDAQYDVAQFKSLTKQVAKECHWNMSRRTKGVLRTVEPGHDLEE